MAIDMSMNFVSSLDSNAEAGRLDEDFGRHFEEEVEIMLTVCQYIGSLRRVLTYELTSLRARAYEL
jgi:hypothetical protein